MSEADGPPPVPPGTTSAAGAATPAGPRFAWFDGIVEGRLGDADAVRGAAARANASGFGRMDVGVEGGRFSVLMDDATVPASRMSDENRRLFAAALAEIAGASSGSVESTLRCTEVFRDEVRETLFLPESGAIRALTRTRPVAPGDLLRSPEAPAPAPSMGRGRLAVVLAALLVAFGIIAWAGGWVDRLFAADSRALVVETGPFADFVDVAVEKSWGEYEVTLRRGKGFPVERGRLDELRAKAATPADRAAIDIVAQGGQLWVRLLDASGRSLAASRTELRPLVAGADRSVEVALPGRITAARVRLDLDAGPEFK
jgi:hypothetical protein